MRYRVLLVLIVIGSFLMGVNPVSAQGADECPSDMLLSWLMERQSWRNATQDILDAQGISVGSALLSLSSHLQKIEDLPRPACADEAMLWTYYLYSNFEHLLICSQNNDATCRNDVLTRLKDYRAKDDAMIDGLGNKVGFTANGNANLRPPGWVPTATPIPPTSAPAPQTRTLGPIWDELYDETYNTEVSVSNVRYSSGDGFFTPKTGSVFVIVDVTVRNLGPGSLRSIGPMDFQVRDGNGALRDYTFVADGVSDCELDLVDLTAGGTISGCVGFEVPDSGTLELIYAPYQYEGLQDGRYLGFQLR